jgi:hypothetical protein
MQTIITLLLLAASPETASGLTGTDTPAPTAAKPVKIKKVCRAGAATGTRLTSKICKTQAEWDAQIGADSTKIDNQRSNGGSGY